MFIYLEYIEILNLRGVILNIDIGEVCNGKLKQ